MPEPTDVASLRSASGGSSRSYVITDPPTVVSSLTGGGERGYRIGAEEAAGGQQLTTAPIAGALDTQRGGADDNSARGGHLDQVAPVVPVVKVFATGTRVDAETEDFLANEARVRRLTPTEGERLQGFPDGWTFLPEQVGRGENNPPPDAHRNSQMGNAVTVPVAQWIGERILTHG